MRKDQTQAGITELYEALVHGVPATLYRCLADDDGTTLFIGPQIQDALGYPVTEWLSQSDIWTELLHPDDREMVLSQWDRCRDEGIVFDCEYRLIGADGRRTWVHDRARPGIDEDGREVWHGVIVDITAARAREERHQEETFFLTQRVKDQEAKIAESDALIDLEVKERNAVEADLRISEERVRSLKAQLRSSWLYTWDIIEGRVTGGFNDLESVRELGVDPEEAIVADDGYWRRFIHPADVERVWAKIRQASMSGATFEDSYRWVKPSGETRWILDRAIATHWDPVAKRGAFVGLMVDVSDLMGQVKPEE